MAYPKGNGTDDRTRRQETKNTCQVPLDDGIDFAALLAADLPEPSFVVGGFIPTGLSILAAKPKIGKSWLVYLIAIAVAGGYACIGGRNVRRGPVLYLALEDTRRRLQDRGRAILSGATWQPVSGLDLRTQWPRASSGGLQAVGEWMADHQGGLVIVDTLARFRDATGGRGNSYEADYEAISGLKQLGDSYGVAVIVVHHTRKAVAEDPFDEVSGTLGINGAADSILVLDRARTSNSAAMYVTGRDIEEQTAAMDFSGGVWTVTGQSNGIERPEQSGAPNKVERCKTWLLQVLGDYSWPTKEVESLAKRNGLTFDNLKEAKAALKNHPETPVTSRPQHKGGPWWIWRGGPQDRPPVRPTPETPHSPDSCDSAVKTSSCDVDGPYPHTPESPHTWTDKGRVGRNSDIESPDLGVSKTSQSAKSRESGESGSQSFSSGVNRGPSSPRFSVGYLEGRQGEDDPLPHPDELADVA